MNYMYNVYIYVHKQCGRLLWCFALRVWSNLRLSLFASRMYHFTYIACTRTATKRNVSGTLQQQRDKTHAIESDSIFLFHSISFIWFVAIYSCIMCCCTHSLLRHSTHTHTRRHKHKHNTRTRVLAYMNNEHWTLGMNVLVDAPILIHGIVYSVYIVHVISIFSIGESMKEIDEERESDSHGFCVASHMLRVLSTPRQKRLEQSLAVVVAAPASSLSSFSQFLCVGISL